MQKDAPLILALGGKNTHSLNSSDYLNNYWYNVPNQVIMKTY